MHPKETRPMNTKRVTWTVLLAAGIIVAVGCGKKDEPAKSPTPKPPTPDVTPKAGPASADGLTKMGGGLTKSPTTAPSTTRPGATEPDVAVAPTGKAPTPDKRAQDLIDAAIKSIKDKRFDDARQSLDKVDAMKDSVSEEVRKQAKTVRANLDSQRFKPAEPAPAAAGEDNK